MHLYFPLGARPPFQPVIYYPGLYAFQTNVASETAPLFELPYINELDFIIRSGRALIWPILIPLGRSDAAGVTTRESRQGLRGLRLQPAAAVLMQPCCKTRIGRKPFGKPSQMPAAGLPRTYSGSCGAFHRVFDSRAKQLCSSS